MNFICAFAQIYQWLLLYACIRSKTIINSLKTVNIIIYKIAPPPPHVSSLATYNHLNSHLYRASSENNHKNITYIYSYSKALFHVITNIKCVVNDLAGCSLSIYEYTIKRTVLLIPQYKFCTGFSNNNLRKLKKKKLAFAYDCHKNMNLLYTICFVHVRIDLFGWAMGNGHILK